MSFKTCSACQNYLDRAFTPADDLIFRCKYCFLEYPSEPKDTLIFEQKQFENSGTDMYKTFIELAPFDPAQFRVLRDCKKCKNPYMALARIGETQKTIYACKCGYYEEGE